MENKNYYDETKISVQHANEAQLTVTPTIHLSAGDGKTVAEATQIIFHKINGGKLSFEIWGKEGIDLYYIADFEAPVWDKLREFFNNPTCY